ncbi:MAG: NAD(P)/FAD-dependent oxidoreductase [bacterium]|nr:NAD(P)/FAD-dependent oxidoreductase [bacterium]
MKIIVVGAGAAGLIAAGKAAESGCEVVLLERNDRVGKKLLITGKGRCNITNSAETEDMIEMYPTNPKFLYSALYTFTNSDIVELVERNGTKTKVERGGRVFPVSDKASDVVKALRKYALKPNVTLIQTRVTGLIIKNGEIRGVHTGKGDMSADRVIICTGGCSYPGTGSTGDGYAFAEQAGHTVTELRPSLVPLETEERFVKDIMGLSLKNVKITAFNEKGRKQYEDFGEMLFTHFGISGPIVLSMSAHLKKGAGYNVEIDLKPALDEGRLKARIMRDFEKAGKKHLINSLDALLPKAIIPLIINMSGIEPHKSVCEITREERAALINVIKHFRLTIKGFRPIEEAIVTSGGIKVSEIDSSTMESKKVKGLYFAGEIIDIDGYTGGFNLQAAFSTGYLAGMNAAA